MCDDNGMCEHEEDYFIKLVKCGCGNEWYMISGEGRTVQECDGCGMLHDIWLEDFLLTGTMQDVVDWMEAEDV